MMYAFTLPQFPVSLNKLSASGSSFEAGMSSNELKDIAKSSTRVDQETRTRTETRERESDGIWEGIRSFFGKKYYKKVQVEYTVDIVRADAQNFKSNAQRFLQDKMIDAIEDAHDEMKDDVKKKIEDIYIDVQDQCKEIAQNYQDIFGTFKEDIDAAINETSEHKKAIEHDIGILIDIDKNIAPFFELWKNILYGEGAR